MKGSGIVAVFLAAGKSSRMGCNKLSLPLRTTTIGNFGLQTALKSKVDHIFLVSRTEDSLEWIDSNLFLNPFRNKWTSVTCIEADKGQAHSLHCGINAAKSLNPKGIMILLADQPLLSKKIINDICLKYVNNYNSKNNISFLAASFQGIPRPPVIFSTNLIPELLKLKGDEGARKLIQSNSKGLIVEYGNYWDFFDVDTKIEYDVLKGAEQNHDK